MFPQIFGKYVLERPIAVGGMARVFLATLRGAGGFEKKLVVKQIRAELATDEGFVTRFVAEAKTTVELSHPNIVPVYELGVEQGVYFLAMELCDGVTLAELLQHTGKLRPEEGAYLGIEICRALDYAHRKARIIHRDVTPRNVIIDEEGAVRLIDFGIAAPAFAGAREVFGSPGHMPPEQLRGEAIGPSTDVFAVATLLYETWTAVAPFRRATPEDCEQALFQPVPSIESIEPGLVALSELVGRALALDAKARPESAEELSRPLRKFIVQCDLGDLARNLGARVRGYRAARESTAEKSEPACEVTSVVDVTRTFATRPLDLTPASESPNPPAMSDLGATRRMSDDAPNWSTGDAAHKPHAVRFTTRARWIIAASVGAGLLWGAWDRWFERNATPVRAAQPWVRPVVLAPSMTALPSPPAEGQGQALLDATATSIEPIAAAPLAPVAAAPPTPIASAPTALARVKILASPEANVQVDGRSRGAAPTEVTLSAGVHHVVLTCVPLGEILTRDLSISAGDALTVSGDFTGAKARLIVRGGR